MFFTINVNNFKNGIKDILFGMLIGASVIIPGLSGGTTAIILGIYDEILSYCNRIGKQTLTSIKYLLPYAFGGLIGIIVASAPIKYILKSHQLIFSYFVIGILVGGAVVLKPSRKMPLPKRIMLSFTGAAPVIIQFIINTRLKLEIENNVLMIILVGLLSAVALILPGISLTNILVMFNCYETIIFSIANFNCKILIIYFLSLIIGIIMSIKILTSLYYKNRENINTVLFGMVLASALQVYSGLPQRGNFLPCILLFFVGFLVTFIIIFKKDTDR